MAPLAVNGISRPAIAALAVEATSRVVEAVCTKTKALFRPTRANTPRTAVRSFRSSGPQPASGQSLQEDPPHSSHVSVQLEQTQSFCIYNDCRTDSFVVRLNFAMQAKHSLASPPSYIRPAFSLTRSASLCDAHPEAPLAGPPFAQQPRSSDFRAGILGLQLRQRRQAIERLGERRRLRAWSGPARGRPVGFWGARCAWPVVKKY
jgi:hypothetical protein